MLRVIQNAQSCCHFLFKNNIEIPIPVMEKRFLVLPFYFLKIKIPKFLLPSFRIFQRLAILFRFFYLLYRLRHQLTDRSVARRLWESSLFRARQDWSEEVGARNFTFPRHAVLFSPWYSKFVRSKTRLQKRTKSREKYHKKMVQPAFASCVSITSFHFNNKFPFQFFYSSVCRSFSWLGLVS